jgi:putative tryptophan/tyrosine transport system substrate-binding protein
MNAGKRLLLILILLSTFTITGVQAQDGDGNFVIGLAILVGTDAFIDEMTNLGYVEGDNITYMIPSYENVPAEEIQAEYTRQVQAMAATPVDVFVTNTDTDAVWIQELTGSNIPTVFARSDDPVATGAVTSLVSPGGSMTGIITNRPHERRLQLMTEINPATDKVYYLYNPTTGEAEIVLQQTKVVAESLGVEVIPAPITDGPSGIQALEQTPEGIDWFFLTPFVPFDFDFFQALNETSVAKGIAIGAVTDLPIPGYMMGYGPNVDDTGRQAARIVDRVLRGANPADLPVETAENFLMVNVETADLLGIEIPTAILRQANLVVRPGYFEALAGSS